MEKLERIPLDLIDEPVTAIRSVMSREGLEELASSIKIYGVIEPIILKTKGERYEILAGHRRFLASQMAGFVDVPAIVRDGDHPHDPAITMEENIQREDVNAVDIARYLRYFISEKGLKPKDLALKFNKTVSWVSLHLQLLDLDPMLQAGVEGGQIAYASALELQKVDNPVARESYARSAITGGASHRVVCDWVGRYRQDEEFRRKVDSGEYAEPATVPPEPLTFTCFLCGERHSDDEMISARTAGECFDTLRQLAAAWRKSMKEDLMEGEHGEDG